MAVASIVLAYNEGVLLATTVPFYEYGWLWGILFILTSRTFDDAEDQSMAKWSDIRVKLVWIIFASNVALIGLLYATKIFYLQNAAQLTSLLFILYALWTLSNMLAFKISDNLNSLFMALGKQELARGAVVRIGDIARGLLENYKKPAGKDGISEIQAMPHNLVQLIESILAEKRAQYCSRPGIVLEFVNLAKEAKANVNPVEFQRIISNLINNAVESFESEGQVIVELSGRSGRVLLQVSDNGKGIPPATLKKLGQKRRDPRQSRRDGPWTLPCQNLHTELGWGTDYPL